MKNKQAKEELKQIKKAEKTLVRLSKVTNQKLGIIAANINDNIFQLEGGKYIQIYAIKPAILPAEKEEELLNELLNKQSNRIRITCIHKVIDGKRGQQIYLTVYVEETDYYHAKLEFDDVMNILENVANNINLKFDICTLEQVIAFSCYNYSKAMKEVTLNEVLKSDCYDLIFGEESDNKLSFSCYDYPEQLPNIKEILVKYSNDVMVALDLYPLDENDKKIYENYLEQQYNHSVEEGYKSYCNLSYGLFLEVAKENVKQIKEQLYKELSQHNFVIYNNDDNDLQYRSGCTMGIVDYHKMKMVETSSLVNLML